MRRTLLLALTPLFLLADEPQPRSCRLKVAWWDAPTAAVPPVLALGPDFKSPKEFAPQVMNFGTEAHCLGDTAEFALKRVDRDPRTGKEIVSWDPFATVSLPVGDDTLGVVMITDASGKRGQGRAFHLGETKFPLGTVRLVNLTGRQLMLGLDGTGVQVAPGLVGTHPHVFGKREVAEIGVMALVDGEPRPVFSTKSEFSGLYRLVLFVAEIPKSDPTRFEVRTVIDFPQPEAKPATKPPGNGAGNGTGNGTAPAHNGKPPAGKGGA